jgi:hypothetical protein
VLLLLLLDYSELIIFLRGARVVGATTDVLCLLIVFCINLGIVLIFPTSSFAFAVPLGFLWLIELHEIASLPGKYLVKVIREYL